MYGDITIEEIIDTFKRTRKCKLPGIDKIKTSGYFTNTPHINNWQIIFQKSLKNLKNIW